MDLLGVFKKECSEKSEHSFRMALFNALAFVPGIDQENISRTMGSS